MSRDATDLRVGLIGYGLAGACFHAPLIAATPGLRLAAVVTSDPERARHAEARYPGVRVLPASEALWELADTLDLVVVATPNRSHVPLAGQALAAGLAVVVDKPLAPTAAEARALIEAARRCGRLLTVFQNRRWDGDFLTVRRLLREGRLGAVHRFESRFERWRPVPKPGWRQDPAPEAAGGVLYDLGSHLIDQARVLFGAIESVYAELDCWSPGGTVEDDAFVALTHVSGVRSQLWMSAVAAQAGPRFRVLGSGGAYAKFGLDGQEEALRAGAQPDRPDWGVEPRGAWGRLGTDEAAQPVPGEAGAYPRFYRDLVHALREGGAPPVDPADALAGLEVIEAARRAAAERRTVRLTAS